MTLTQLREAACVYIGEYLSGKHTNTAGVQLALGVLNLPTRNV